VTGEWEPDVEKIMSVRKNRKNSLLVRILWTNGQTTEETTDDVHVKAPLKLIKYYENHLKL